MPCDTVESQITTINIILMLRHVILAILRVHCIVSVNYKATYCTMRKFVYTWYSIKYAE